MGKPDIPPPPDFASAATATAAGNEAAARIAATANRIDQYTPLGNVQYTQGVGGNQDHWRSDVGLTPVGQRQFDQQQRINSSLNNVAENGLGYVSNTLQKPFDFNALPANQINAGQTAQNAIMSRLTPQFNIDENALHSRLLNQGITPGSEAEKNALDTFGRQKNDAYIQAGLHGINTGQQAREQALQEQEFGRNEPLNMINALRTGSQVQLPTFQTGPGQQVAAPGPDLLGAANSQYGANLGRFNAQQQAGSNFMGGLFSLGAAGLGNSSLFSDRRLKKNIQPLGTLPSGLPFYRFDYADGTPALGVMADEAIKLFPDAVTENADGFQIVNYAAIH